MKSSTLLTVASLLVCTSAATPIIGFNYASTNDDTTPRIQSTFETQFNLASSLTGFPATSARLYTSIQGGTTAQPISAIPAAIATKTRLLLGVWASAGQASVTNEIAALTSAVATYGTTLVNLIDGISVGSEDLYRTSVTGIENDSGVGVDPATLVTYVKAVRAALAGTVASGVKIGHVDTWNAWVNSSNSAVIDAIDWLGVDEYPWFQTTDANTIANAGSLFFSAYDATVAVAGSKPVWVTETGWPTVASANSNNAVPSVANAQSYYQQVYCNGLKGKTNTWWYILTEAAASPNFGVVSTAGTPLYNLTCPASTPSPTSSAVVVASSSTSRIATALGAGSAATTHAATSASASGTKTGAAGTGTTSTHASSASASAGTAAAGIASTSSSLSAASTTSAVATHTAGAVGLGESRAIGAVVLAAAVAVFM